MDKKTIRREVLKARSIMEKDYKIYADGLIFDSLINSSIYKRAENIFIYVSYGSEVDTKKIIQYSLDNNKNIYVPRINTDNKTMNAVKINSLSMMSVNKYGILEPHIVDKNDIGDEFDLIIIPGAAFDTSGNRIGYGGGYYDKYLSSINNDGCRVALAYNFQIVNDIKAEEHDEKVECIITDKELIYI